MQPIEILRSARKLLSDPRKWTKEAYARDEAGYDILPNKYDAKTFCIMGAINRTCGSLVDEEPEYLRARRAVIAATNALYPGFFDVFCFNDDDNTTHEMILAVLDRAIADIGNPPLAKEIETA